MTTKLTLTADTNTTKVGGKAGFLTHAMIKSGNLIVATGKLVGKYDGTQALAEFVKNPGKFTLAPKFASLTPAVIRALAAA
jgi:hypothetical protein